MPVSDIAATKKSSIYDLVILSGVEEKIIQELPPADIRPYVRISILNIIISLLFTLACYFIFFVLFNFSNLWSFAACPFYFLISIYIQKNTSGSQINKPTSESKFLFFLTGFCLSLVVGLAVLIFYANSRRTIHDNKLGKNYELLTDAVKQIIKKRAVFSEDKFMRSVYSREISQVTTYINDFSDSNSVDYKKISDNLNGKIKVIVKDSTDLSDKTTSLSDKINTASSILSSDKYYSFVNTNYFFDSSESKGNQNAKLDTPRIIEVNKTIKELHSIPLLEITGIVEYFNPTRFNGLHLVEKLWYISYYTDAFAIFLLIAVTIVVMLFFMSILITSNTYKDDLYHQLLLEQEKLSSEALEKQRKKISDQFRLQTEIRITKSTLQNLDEPSEESKKEIEKIIGGLTDDLSTSTLFTAAEFEFTQNRNEKALEYINKAIELEAEIFSSDKNYIPSPQFYELKSKVLNNLNSSAEAKLALDRFAELNNEKKFQFNLTQEILLQRLQLENLPFYGNFNWAFKPGINILLGKNGYGKSHLFSLLIALLYEDKTKIREWIPPTASATTRAKLYISSPHAVNIELVEHLNNKLDELYTKKSDIENQINLVKNNDNSKPELETLESEVSKINLEIQTTLEKIDAEQNRIVGNKDGIISNIGKIPILGIPDSRFIDKTESASSNNKSDFEDLKRDGASAFLYSRAFGEIIKKGLFIVAQNNSSDFSKEPYSLIERVISDLAGINITALESKSNIEKPPFFRFVRIETSSTTGNYNFLVKSEESDDEFPLQKISQGTFSVLAICLMIYRFLYELRPDSKNVLHEKAIILIDEIDAHLHPSWEQRIIGILRREFPNVQFIISAHSPLIVAGCFEDEVSVLRRSGSGFIIDQLKENFIGYSTSDLLKRVFEIEDKDEHYLFYSTLADQEEILKTRLDELERKEINTKNDIDIMTELSKQLSYIRTVKKIKETKVNVSILKTQNMSLKAEVDILKDRIKNSKSSS